MKIYSLVLLFLFTACSDNNTNIQNNPTSNPDAYFNFPVDCSNGCSFGYADIDSDGLAFNCDKAGYIGHNGTDIGISWNDMDNNTNIYSAEDGEIIFVSDNPNAFDRCVSDETHPDCKDTELTLEPNLNDGNTVCTESSSKFSPENKDGKHFWCFSGKNVIMIKHKELITIYQHLKSGSIKIKEGDMVKRGDILGYVGSAGKSTGPHLHFEVWKDFGKPIDPYYGECSKEEGKNLF